VLDLDTAVDRSVGRAGRRATVDDAPPVLFDAIDRWRHATHNLSLDCRWRRPRASTISSVSLHTREQSADLAELDAISRRSRSSWRLETGAHVDRRPHISTALESGCCLSALSERPQWGGRPRNRASTPRATQDRQWGGHGTILVSHVSFACRPGLIRGRYSIFARSQVATRTCLTHHLDSRHTHTHTQQ
jgi:hypothetical protein